MLTNCRLLDTRTGQCSSFGHSVVIKRGRIEAVDAQLPPQGAVVINCSGLVLMPGVCHSPACRTSSKSSTEWKELQHTPALLLCKNFLQAVSPQALSVWKHVTPAPCSCTHNQLYHCVHLQACVMRMCM